MASTKKTSKLKLSQWEAGDAFLREDINSDFSTIDAEISARPLIKLADYTVSQSGATVTVSLSNVSFSGIVEMRVYCPTSTYMAINGVTSGYQFYATNSSWQETSSKPTTQIGTFIVNNSNGLNSSGGTIFITTGLSGYKVEASGVGGVRSLVFERKAGFSVGDKILVLGVKR